MTAAELTARLTAAGIAIDGLSERDEAADAGVYLVDDRHVQIAGASSFFLNQWDEEEDGVRTLAICRSVGELVKAIRGHDAARRS